MPTSEPPSPRAGLGISSSELGARSGEGHSPLRVPPPGLPKADSRIRIRTLRDRTRDRHLRTRHVAPITLVQARAPEIVSGPTSGRDPGAGLEAGPGAAQKPPRSRSRAAWAPASEVRHFDLFVHRPYHADVARTCYLLVGFLRAERISPTCTCSTFPGRLRKNPRGRIGRRDLDFRTPHAAPVILRP